MDKITLEHIISKNKRLYWQGVAVGIVIGVGSIALIASVVINLAIL